MGRGNAPMDNTFRRSVAGAMGNVPSGLFVLTARHEDRRMGMLASWVQQVSFEPPMLSVAVAKGRSIMPLISESRRFALCQIAQSDRLIRHKFTHDPPPGEDPFLGLELVEGPRGQAPILAQALAYMACELACHMDVEGDHDLFVGQVRDAHCHPGDPAVHLRDNGFEY